MNYEIGKMKLDELVGYFRDGKMNLIPPFQRGRVWTSRLRQKLLENMVRGKPIPAIFLYLEASGSRFSYNILDGKQRLESILLFIADGRTDLLVPNWRDYFFKAHSGAHFKINVAQWRSFVAARWFMAAGNGNYGVTNRRALLNSDRPCFEWSNKRAARESRPG